MSGPDGPFPDEGGAEAAPPRRVPLFGDGSHLRPALPLRVALAYALLAGLWIVFSDRLLLLIPVSAGTGQTWKGLGFVGVTAALLYAVLRRGSRGQERALAEARAASNMLGALMEGSPEAIVVLDREGRVAEWSRAAERMFGWTAAEVIGGPPPTILPEESEDFDRLRARVLSGERLPGLEARRGTKDGRVLDVALSGAPVIGPGGEARGVFMLVTDVTERRRAELELRRSEERYRRLFVANPHPMYLWDAETRRFLAVNDAAVATYGWTREEFLTMTLSDIRPEEDVPAFERYVATMPKGYRNAGLWRHRRKDGALMDVDIVTHSIRFAGRDAWLTLASDVTERRRIEEERARRDAQHRALAEAALSVNSADGLKEILETVTQRARDILGAHQAVTSLNEKPGLAPAIRAVSLSESYEAWRTYDEIPDGSGIYALVCRENRPMRMTQAELEAHPAFKGFGAAKERHPPMRGWLAAPLTSREGASIGLIQLSDKNDGAFTEDDTSILVLLAQLASVAIENARLLQEVRLSAADLERRVVERTAQLRETNAALESFSYSVSHDLRAPLRAMQGFAQALLDDQSARLDEEGRDFCRRIVEASLRMDLLIQDLLAYSRVTREEIRLERLELPAVVRAALEQVSDKVRESGATVEVGTHLPDVIAHRPILVQIVANLLSNAVKFHKPGAAPRVRVRAETRDMRVRLWVEDDGVGIAPEHHERIFRVFERLHGSETYEGTGIGLAIVRRGAERMGARTGLESEPGAGSRFWVEMPAA